MVAHFSFGPSHNPHLLSIIHQNNFAPPPPPPSPTHESFRLPTALSKPPFLHPRHGRHAHPNSFIRAGKCNSLLRRFTWRLSSMQCRTRSLYFRYYQPIAIFLTVLHRFCYLLPSMIPPGKPGSPRPLSFLLRLTHAAHYAGLSLASLWMLSYMVRVATFPLRDFTCCPVVTVICQLIITSARVQSSSAAAISPFVPNSASSWLLCERQPAMSKDFYRLSYALACNN